MFCSWSIYQTKVVSLVLMIIEAVKFLFMILGTYFYLFDFDTPSLVYQLLLIDFRFGTQFECFFGKLIFCDQMQNQLKSTKIEQIFNVYRWTYLDIIVLTLAVTNIFYIILITAISIHFKPISKHFGQVNLITKMFSSLIN